MPPRKQKSAHTKNEERSWRFYLSRSAGLSWTRRDQPLAVTSLQENRSRRPGGLVIFEVEQYVLVHDKPSQLPLVSVRGSLEQVAPFAAVVHSLFSKMQQLNLVESHGGFACNSSRQIRRQQTAEQKRRLRKTVPICLVCRVPNKQKL